MELISHRLRYAGRFGDKRLAARAEKISFSLLASRVSSIRSATSNESEQRGFYRFINNEKVTEKELIKAHQQQCQSLSSARNLLVIQDTTQIDLSSHQNRLKENSGYGPIGNHGGVGFFLHGCLVIDADRLTLIGISSLQLWHRKATIGNIAARKKAYRLLSIEDKESGKWIRGAWQSKECLNAANQITIIEDREGDIYEQFIRIPDERTHLIIRSRENRKLNTGEKLFDVLKQTPLAGIFELKITKDLRKDRAARVAKMEVRYKTVEIQRPSLFKKDKTLPPSMSLSAIEVMEITPGVAAPVIWRLLTTCPINSYDEALWAIHQYKQRWLIEQFFRVMKKKGFRIEDSELETAWAVRKLTVLVINAVLRVMQMLLAYDNENAQHIDEVYEKKEQQCLELLNKKMETDTLKNPYSQQSLTWATWIIARLGGWKGRKSQGLPGPIVMKNGLDKFTLIYQGWLLALSP
ncbi:MAG TPA: IS4 family transposase [Bacteroidia bacterium]|jgi:hypothetical protein|nr:IS4 family transposase [Bacteroidia bacterium]